MYVYMQFVECLINCLKHFLKYFILFLSYFSFHYSLLQYSLVLCNLDDNDIRYEYR